MVVVRNLIIVIVAVVILVRAPLAYANVASGAVTGRGVYTLSASGAATVGSAEATVANAVRLLGSLGRLAGYVGLAFVVYDIVSNTWDWWQQEYDSGAAGVQSTTAGSWGLTAGDNVGLGVYGQSGYGYVLCGAASPWPGVKQWWLGYEPSFASVMAVGAIVTWQGQYDCQNVALQLLAAPTVSGVGLPASGASGRDEFLATVDSVVSEINAGTFEAANGTGQAYTAGTQEMKDQLLAARDIVANGVALPSDGTTSIDSAASTGSMPGSVPSSGETTSGDSSAAIAAGLAAVSAAIAASQAAVVAAVGAIPSAIAAAGAATVSAVQAVQAGVVAAVETIPAAIAASQAAVVSAVQAIPAAITDAKTAIVAAIQAQPVGGAGSATEAINQSAAADAAREQKADDKAASTSAPDVVCPVCNREDKWSESWATLRDAAMAAPVFGLINRIAINPVGTIQRVQTVSTRYGGLTFDLSAWGVDTYIGVVRYVVIVAALIAGYFVIFG